nr:uncharacterized protein LOC109179941 [Ipomoea batatas]
MGGERARKGLEMVGDGERRGRSMAKLTEVKRKSKLFGTPNEADDEDTANQEYERSGYDFEETKLMKEVKDKEYTDRVQAYNIPPSMQTKKIAKMIGAFLGSFRMIDEANMDGLWRRFMRVRVQLDVTKPLKRKMRVKPPRGEAFYIDFKYERLTTFCFIYELSGHNENSCDICWSLEKKTEKVYWIEE